MNVHFGGTIAFRFVCFHHHSPQHACGAEFGNFHKVVAAHAKIEFDGLGGFVNRQACIGEHIEVLCAPRQRIAEFLRARGSGVVQADGIDTHHFVGGQAPSGFNHLSHFAGNLFGRQFFAAAQHGIHRVEINAAAQSVQIVTFCFEIVGQQSDECHCFATAHIKIQFDAVGVNAVEQRSNVLFVELLFVEFETKRIDAFVQNIARLGIGCLGIFCIDVLTNQPHIVSLDAAHKREYARSGIGGFDSLEVFGTIERHDVKSFICSPNELFVKIGSFEVGFDFSHPLFGADGGEIGQQI